jgi:hypothetical protein
VSRVLLLFDGLARVRSAWGRKAKRDHLAGALRVLGCDRLKVAGRSSEQLRRDGRDGARQVELADDASAGALGFVLDALRDEARRIAARDVGFTRETRRDEAAGIASAYAAVADCRGR